MVSVVESDRMVVSASTPCKRIRRNRMVGSDVILLGEADFTAHAKHDRI